MKPAFKLAFALTMLAWPGGSQARSRIVETEISPPHTVVVRDLLGLAPAQVQRRLTGLDADWPRNADLEVSSERGLLSFAAVDEYLFDPAATEGMARARTDGASLPKVSSSCSVKAEPDGDGPLLLMFRNDRLEGVWSRRNAGPDTTFRPTVAGALPLADGEAFLAHWGRILVGEGTRLTVRCVRRERAADQPVQVRARREGLSASDMQGLALLPFAVGLPAMNSGRSAHQRAGAAFYAQLAPGYRLPDAPRRFASEHAGVRAMRGSDPDYVVLKIDLGGYSSRNLANVEDFGLVGVRNGIVAWRAVEYGLASPRLPPVARR